MYHLHRYQWIRSAILLKEYLGICAFRANLYFSESIVFDVVLAAVLLNCPIFRIFARYISFSSQYSL